MKKALLAVIAAVLAVCSGCMKENRDDCPEEPYNLILHFVYLDEYDPETEGDVFPEHIDKVDLVIFDQQKNFHSRIPLDEPALDEFQGAKLQLTPGLYYIVAWGNAKDRTELGSGSVLDDSYLRHQGTATTDPLFYAPYKQTKGTIDYTIYAIEVPGRGVEERTLEFMGAHHRINVYVSGYEDANTPGNTKPRIEVTDLFGRYNYHLLPGEEKIQLRQITGEVIIKGEEIETANFYTPHFANENTIEVRVKRPSDDQIEYVVDLQKFLRDNDYEMIDGARISVDIYIEFGEMDVKVSVPDWIDTNTGGVIS